jgi:hypothetical protein
MTLVTDRSLGPGSVSVPPRVSPPRQAGCMLGGRRSAGKGFLHEVFHQVFHRTTVRRPPVRAGLAHDTQTPPVARKGPLWDRPATPEDQGLGALRDETSDARRGAGSPGDSGLGRPTRLAPSGASGGDGRLHLSPRGCFPQNQSGGRPKAAAAWRCKGSVGPLGCGRKRHVGAGAH